MKYEIHAIGKRYPSFEDCPEFVEVDALFPTVEGLTDDQRKRLSKGIEAAIAKQDKRKREKGKR